MKPRRAAQCSRYKRAGNAKIGEATADETGPLHCFDFGRPGPYPCSITASIRSDLRGDSAARRFIAEGIRYVRIGVTLTRHAGALRQWLLPLILNFATYRRRCDRASTDHIVAPLMKRIQMVLTRVPSAEPNPGGDSIDIIGTDL